jgi:hypothetical protein
MRNIIYTIAVILVIIWALGSFAFHVTSSLIHIVLVVAVVLILLNLIRGNRRPLD